MKILGILSVVSVLSFGSNCASFAGALASAQESNSQQTPTRSGSPGQPPGPPQATPIQENSAADNVNYRPGSGTLLVVELLDAVDTKKSVVGAQVVCVVRQDLLYKGNIIVPHDARVMGHVTEAVGYTKEHSSRLGMLFEKIVLKDKRELPFQYPAVIEAVARPVQHQVVPTSRLDQMPVQMEKGKSTGAAALDAVQSNPNILGANFPQTTGVISAANRGVVGIKGLTLEKSSIPEIVTIVANRGDVKLAPHSQMVLRMINGAK